MRTLENNAHVHKCLFHALHACGHAPKGHKKGSGRFSFDTFEPFEILLLEPVSDWPVVYRLSVIILEGISGPKPCMRTVCSNILNFGRGIQRGFKGDSGGFEVPEGDSGLGTFRRVWYLQQCAHRDLCPSSLYIILMVSHPRGCVWPQGGHRCHHSF